jgi:hypothetical protein
VTTDLRLRPRGHWDRHFPEIFENNISTTQSKWIGLTADIAKLRMKMNTEFVLKYIKESNNLVDLGVDVRILVREVLGK